MAKSKSARAATSASNGTSKGNPSARAQDGKTSSSARPEAETRHVLTNENIGRVAGDVWQLLDRDGGLTLAAIKKAIDAPDDLILAAIGWLAREDKLSFAKVGRSLTISLQ